LALRSLQRLNWKPVDAAAIEVTMDFKDETQKIECLMEVLYPELFPESDPCSEHLRQYSRALEESRRCSARADTFKEEISHIRERVLENLEGTPELALMLSIELASSTALWQEALNLIRDCETWSREKKGSPVR
jgi:hypothetical protein